MYYIKYNLLDKRHKWPEKNILDKKKKKKKNSN